RGDPALPGQVVTDEGNLANLGIAHDGELPADLPGPLREPGSRKGYDMSHTMPYHTGLSDWCKGAAVAARWSKIEVVHRDNRIPTRQVGDRPEVGVPSTEGPLRGPVIPATGLRGPDSGRLAPDTPVRCKYRIRGQSCPIRNQALGPEG